MQSSGMYSAKFSLLLTDSYLLKFLLYSQYPSNYNSTEPFWYEYIAPQNSTALKTDYCYSPYSLKPKALFVFYTWHSKHVLFSISIEFPIFSHLNLCVKFKSGWKLPVFITTFFCDCMFCLIIIFFLICIPCPCPPDRVKLIFQFYPEDYLWRLPWLF